LPIAPYSRSQITQNYFKNKLAQINFPFWISLDAKAIVSEGIYAFLPFILTRSRKAAKPQRKILHGVRREHLAENWPLAFSFLPFSFTIYPLPFTLFINFSYI
jgi:hypothetical protein